MWNPKKTTISKKVWKERETKWTEDNVAGFPEAKGWRRSKRVQEIAEAEWIQTIAKEEQGIVTRAHDISDAEIEVYIANEDTAAVVSPETVQGFVGSDDPKEE